MGEKVSEERSGMTLNLLLSITSLSLSHTNKYHGPIERDWGGREGVCVSGKRERGEREYGRREWGEREIVG